MSVNTQIAMSMNQSPMFFCNDLLTEVLSLLPVKSLLRFCCVSKSWITLVYDHSFVKMHLKRSSAREQQITLITYHIQHKPEGSFYGSDYKSAFDYIFSCVPYPICRLFSNPSFTPVVDPYYYLKNDKGCSSIVGSCNGLICLVGESFINAYHEYWFHLWNPSTRTISKKIGYFCDFNDYWYKGFKFTFGCDNSTSTYKVLASCYNHDQLTSDVRLFSLGDNVWRNIESFPAVPIRLNYCFFGICEHDGVFLNGTFNWLAVQSNIQYCWSDVMNFTVEQFVIISLDLATETYNQYLLPQGFDMVPHAEPNFGVLGDCLCFSYSYKETDLVIWQMKEFGVEESWTQFLKISYHNLQLHYDFSDNFLKYHLHILPLFLSKDGDTLILHSSQEREAILYNWRDNRVERTRVNYRTNNSLLWCKAKGYVESLISIC